MYLSFIIPVFNEEESLEELHDEITQNTVDNRYEIIFIDDGSTDNSYKKLEELKNVDKNVKVIKFRKNFGKAAALQAGFDNAEGDIIFTMDADLQDNPNEIHKMIEKLQEGYDLVSGWKIKRKDPISKTLPSKLFNFVTSKIFKLKLHDYNCGFKAYRKEVVKELDIYGEMHRYIPAIAHSKGFHITEIPVNHRKREHGVSKYGFERYLRGFFDLLTVKTVTNYSKYPLYLFGGIGFLLSLIGFLIGLYLTYIKFFHDAALSNRPLLFLSILLIMVGIQFFSIGLLSELLVNLNRRHNKSRNISIEKKLNFSKDED